jgi:hypothetical protein
MWPVTTTEERWARAERKLEVGYARRIRRTPAVVVAVLGLLVLAVGVTAAVDLRRLQTPHGATLAWTEAAVFGNCRAFLELSEPVDPTTERRSDDELCRTLRRRTEDARGQTNRIEITAGTATQRGDTATVPVEVRRPGGTVRAVLDLIRRGDRWLVLRDEIACGSVGCP